MKHLAGTTVQGWLLANPIGRGADAIVYSATKDGVDAAVKIFFPEALEKNGLASARERLELQLALIGRKHHPNLVEIYDGGEDATLGTLFLVMEFVPGTSLDKLVGRIPSSAVAALACQLACAAEHLETLELVHRDIKPANIVVSDDFSKLTLLDLGIVHPLPSDDERGRLSGLEFVATLRYSPPEFVWRTEQGDADGAWRAVTFYQIGATLHDVIMGMVLFDGYDKPRACLYDSVRDRTPRIESNTAPAWLVYAVQACLLKDWRQRLKFVSWTSFVKSTSPPDSRQQETRIRLRQVRSDEMRQAAARSTSNVPSPTREQHLWQLNSTLIVELRTYLMGAPIFPKFGVFETPVSEREYTTAFNFEQDLTRDFKPGVVFTVGVSVDAMMEDASKLTFEATVGGKPIAKAAWTEMFTVEAAFSTCRQSFLDAVESLLPSAGP